MTDAGIAYDASRRHGSSRASSDSRMRAPIVCRSQQRTRAHCPLDEARDQLLRRAERHPERDRVDVNICETSVLQ